VSAPDREGPWDAIVVGGGPAGLSAATWLARHRRSVVVVDSGEYRNRTVRRSHGYLGSDPIDPMALLASGRQNLSCYPGVHLSRARAETARREACGTFVVGVDGAELRSLRLVLATGVIDRFPEVGGFDDHYGIDVFHCPTCDGYEARDRRVVVFGWSQDVAGFTLGLLEWAAEVTVVTDGRAFEGDERAHDALRRHGVDVLRDEATELVGEPGELRAVRLRSGAVVASELVFFSIAHHSRLDLARQLGCATSGEDCLVVDEEGQTTVPGVYGAGDITPGVQLASVAVGKGAVAGVACALSLRGEPGAPGSPAPGPDPGAELGT
jgi:thioredoxin reductase